MIEEVQKRKNDARTGEAVNSMSRQNEGNLTCLRNCQYNLEGRASNFLSQFRTAWVGLREAPREIMIICKKSRVEFPLLDMPLFCWHCS